MRFMDVEPKTAWREYSKSVSRENIVWGEFDAFLLDRIEDPENKHLTVSKRYADAKQKPG